MQSEARSSLEDLTPDVPRDNKPSFQNVGRYYDVAPLPKKDQFLVSWADGPVESGILGMAHASPDFGIYVFDAASKTRFPIVNEIGSWEVNAVPVVQRAEPAMLKGAFQAQGTQSTL